MPLKLRTEQHSFPTFSSLLKDCYAFTVENHGTVECEVAFDKDAMIYVPLPPGTARSFDCTGNTPYEGEILGRFEAAQEGAEVGTRRVVIIKSVLTC